jgi:hypothetical protein
MAYTFDELRKKTVAELRKIADEVQHEAVKGHSQMHKDVLLAALCTALGIETRKHHEASGIDKGAVKAQIKDLKKQRDTALSAHDHVQLKSVRRKIHDLKRAIRKAEF